MDKLYIPKDDWRVIKAHLASKKENEILQGLYFLNGKVYATDGKRLIEYAYLCDKYTQSLNGLYRVVSFDNKAMTTIILEKMEGQYPDVLQYMPLPNEQKIKHFIEHYGINTTSLSLKIYEQYKVAINTDYFSDLPETDFTFYIFTSEKPILGISANGAWRVIILPFKMR